MFAIQFIYVLSIHIYVFPPKAQSSNVFLFPILENIMTLSFFCEVKCIETKDLDTAMQMKIYHPYKSLKTN